MREIHINLGDGEEPPKTLLVPHEPEEFELIAVDEVQSMPDEKRPTACPACGAKFSHSLAESRCQRCFLPDEIRVMGPQMITRWKRQRGAPKHEPKKAIKTKKTNRHGRRGVKR